MPDFRQLQMSRDERGVVTVAFDSPDSPVNVFDDAVVRELSEVVSLLESRPPRAVVFRSAKPSGFFAGADVHHIRELASPVEASRVQAIGQELFDRVERLPIPTVAAVHGVCLGGGLEFALACRYRVARDDAHTKLGLPEVQLGLIPGWGGTVRLPRLIGLREALGMILEGKTVSAVKAAKLGLADRVIPPGEFEKELTLFVEDRLAAHPIPRPRRGIARRMLDETRPGRALVLSTASKRTAVRARDYPAVAAAIRVIAAGVRNGPVAGFTAEREEFPKLLFGPVARNLIALFLDREKARKPATWVSGNHVTKPVNTVAVVGAGVMGAGIAQLLALNSINVVLKDVSADATAAGKKRVGDLTRDAVAKGALTHDAAGAALQNVVATHEPGAIANEDLAIEAVVERLTVKQAVFCDLATRLGPDAILASNTSALSVSRIAEAVDNPGRVAGLHFFNPVHRMPLVEVVRGRATDDATVATLVELTRKLGKVPVVVADGPGFLVNRVLFPYMDEAVRLVLEGVPGENVDREAVQFGMPVGPLELLDQIGTDVAADVAKSFEPLVTDSGPTPSRLAEMVSDRALGMKSSRGFYNYRNGKRGSPTHWAIAPGPQPPRHREASTPGELSDIQRRLIYPMINEAAKCLEMGLVAEPWMVDLALVLGTGFAPFRGGPLRTADSLGIVRIVHEMERLRSTAGERYAPTRLLLRLAAGDTGFYAPVNRVVPTAAAV